jgi:hypothetical protein
MRTITQPDGRTIHVEAPSPFERRAFREVLDHPGAWEWCFLHDLEEHGCNMVRWYGYHGAPEFD